MEKSEVGRLWPMQRLGRGEHREGLPVLRATVAMTLSTECEGPELEWRA